MTIGLLTLTIIGIIVWLLGLRECIKYFSKEVINDWSDLIESLEDHFGVSMFILLSIVGIIIFIIVFFKDFWDQPINTLL